MPPLPSPKFDPTAFLATIGPGKKMVRVGARQNFFSQGQPADSTFYLQSGRAKLTVVSATGKEATISIFEPGSFLGEDAISAIPGLRLATATAVTDCVALKIERSAILQLIHEEHEFSTFLISFLITRGMRIQADLVDQLFNNSEKRLARVLLIMAEFGKPGEPEMFIPRISQETLAEMIGTTRSRVSFFMNRFRKLGFIEYNGRIRVHKSLLNVVLHD
jgi:CRP/FNR family cyclic AMP-dependent transcriptional regulator